MEGVSVRAIATKLSRHPATISRELKRNRPPRSGCYVAISAKGQAEERSPRSHLRHPLKNPRAFSYVLEKLRESWSPEQIAGRLRKERGESAIHHETICRFIYGQKNRERNLWEYLPRKQRRRQKKTGRSAQKVRILQRVSIHRRPEAIDQRTEFGHWEGDTVEGRKPEGDGIHTEVERLSRLFVAVRVDRIASRETITAQQQIFRGLPEPSRRSTTLDNGREHHAHMALRLLRMQTYFADPYSSWQRGTNENTNGLLRRYLPKGPSFQDLSQEGLDGMVEEINNRPRKCLGYNTPREEFEKQLRCCT